METITLKLFDFSALKPEAKEQAIQDQRSSYYEDNDFAAWAIEDDYLLNPVEFNREGAEVVMKIHDKRIFFDCQARYIDITEAIDVIDTEKFLMFLGVPETMHDKVYISFYTSPYRNSSTRIQFDENEAGYTFTEAEDEIISEAEDNFSSYLQDILKRINEDIEYRFSDEAIIEDIEANEMKFLETGKKIYYV